MQIIKQLGFLVIVCSLAGEQSFAGVPGEYMQPMTNAAVVATPYTDFDSSQTAIAGTPAVSGCQTSDNYMPPTDADLGTACAIFFPDPPPRIEVTNRVTATYDAVRQGDLLYNITPDGEVQITGIPNATRVTFFMPAPNDAMFDIAMGGRRAFGIGNNQLLVQRNGTGLYVTPFPRNDRPFRVDIRAGSGGSVNIYLQR